MSKQSLVGLHKFLPQHALSRLVGWLSDRRWTWLKNEVIARFIRHYDVNMDEAEHSDYRQYATFNAFFTRHLKPGARVVATEENAIVSPVDGTVSEVGRIDGDRLLQAKGQHYRLGALLGGEEHATAFRGGHFITVYLAPRDYHRFHMPIEGRLLETVHVPGRLFSVNPTSVANISNLFGRNERVVCFFETAAGPMALVIVGAMLVGGIATVWQGTITPPTQKTITATDYRGKNIVLARGEEVGHFKMGSTVIAVFAEKALQWEAALQADKTLTMGTTIARRMSPDALD